MEEVVTTGFWKGKRVFVTGHTGFKGAWLSLWLESMGAKVGGFALPAPTTPSLYEATGLGRSLEKSQMGDIRDLEDLALCMATFRPEIVLHLAAQALVLPSFEDPVGTFASNVQGTVHVLEAVRRCKDVRVAVMVTSDKCYDNKEWVWGYRETDPMGGKDPYSASKGCSELVTDSFRHSFFGPDSGVALCSARAGNVIGGGDWAAYRLIPDLVRGVQASQPVLIRNPNATRPWQHVLEPLSGYLRLAERAWEDGPAHAEGWNFGPNDSAARSVGWVADRFAELWGVAREKMWVTDGRYFPKESTFLKLDISKAAAKLDWQPRWTADECLPRVAAWYRRYAEGANARKLMLAEIEDYCSPPQAADRSKQNV